MTDSKTETCPLVTLALIAVGSAVVSGCTDPIGGPPINAGPPEWRVIVLESEAGAYRVLDVDSIGIPASIQRVELPVGFAGSSFDVRGTRAIATTGSPDGNELYVTDFATGATSVDTLPAGADPGAARFLSEDTAFVPGRGTGRVYRFVVSTSSFEDLTGDVAQWPVDVVPFGGRLYVIDANADRSAGTTLGPSHVVVVDAGTGAVLHTDTLGGVGAIRGVVAGGHLWVLQAGPSATPGGKLSAVDLSGPQPIVAKELDLQGVGISVETGLDGLLYVALAPDPARPDSTRIAVVDPTGLAFVVTPDDPLDLRRPDSTAATCRAASADAEGGIYCLEPEGGGSLYVYGPDLAGRVAISLGAGPSDLVIAGIP